MDLSNLESQFSGAEDALLDALNQDLFSLSIDEGVKALATSSTIGTDGSALIAESLDPVLKYVVQDPRNFAPKMLRWYFYDAMSNVEEHVRVTELGLSDFANRAEGDLGTQDSPEFLRVTNEVKAYGLTTGVTRRQQKAGAAKFGDIKARVNMLTLKHLLLLIERDFWWARTNFNGLAFNGFFQRALTDSRHTVDLTANTAQGATTGTAGSRTTYLTGGDLSLGFVRNYNEVALDSGQMHSALYVHPTQKQVLSNGQDANARVYLSGQRSVIAAGQVVDQIASDFGQNIDVVWDSSLRNRGIKSVTPKNPAGTKFHQNAPAAPSTAPSTALAANGNLPNGDFYYAFAAVNKVGEGPIVIQSTAATTTNTNGKVTLTLTGYDASTTNTLRIYRSSTASPTYAEMRFLNEVVANSSGTTTYTDDGTILPGETYAMLMDEESTGVGQLIPPSIRDLADIDNSLRSSIDCDIALSSYDGMKAEVAFKGIGGVALDSDL